MKLLITIIAALGLTLLSTQPLPIDESHLMSDKVSRDRKGATIDHVIVHFTSDFIRNPEEPFDVARNVGIFAEYGVSAHYMIGRDGAIYRLVPEARAAFHAGSTTRQEPGMQNMNNRSIGIELLAVGSEADMTGEPVEFVTPEVYRAFAAKHPEFIGYTDAQYAALNALLADILERNPAIKPDREHVLGHDEYAPGRKTDPGELFDWDRVTFE